jgi:hypothetical protein
MFRRPVAPAVRFANPMLMWPLRDGFSWLMVLYNHLEKYEHPIYELENTKCLKPPTSQEH